MLRWLLSTQEIFQHGFEFNKGDIPIWLMTRFQQKWKVSKQPMHYNMNIALVIQSFNDTKYLINPESCELYDIRHLVHASSVQWKVLMRRIGSCRLAWFSSPSWRSAAEVAWNLGVCLMVWRNADEMLTLETVKMIEAWFLAKVQLQHLLY